MGRRAKVSLEIVDGKDGVGVWTVVCNVKTLVGDGEGDGATLHVGIWRDESQTRLGQLCTRPQQEIQNNESRKDEFQGHRRGGEGE